MKVAILAGGRGTRLAEETDVRPKPMVEIGGKPILWHIMKYYEAYGFDDFAIALGYKGDFIKKWMVDYASLTCDVTVNFRNGSVSIGYGSAWLTVKVLEMAGNNLTRENLLKVVASLRDMQLPLGLPGVTVSITPDNYAGYSKLQMSRFDGKTWEPLGGVIAAD